MPDRSGSQRTICLLRPTTIDGVGVFRVRDRRTCTYYVLHEIPCDIGGRGFEVHRLGLGELYHVRVGEPSDCSCECLGFLRYGYCRHILGLRTLVHHGLL